MVTKHPVLTDVYNNGKAVFGEKLFCSYESIFELAKGLRDSQTSINNKDLGLLVKDEAENIYKDNFWSSILCDLVPSSVDQFIYFMLLVAFKSIIKFIQEKDVTVTNVLSYYGHVSIKNINHFVPLLKLLMTIENKLKRKHEHREKVGSLSKVQKKIDNFFLKEF